MKQHQRALIGTATAVVAMILLTAVPVRQAAADPNPPTASRVAAARSNVSSVAAQVGVLQAEVVSALARIEALGQAVDAASEINNGAIYRLGQAQARALAASRAAIDSQRLVEVARVDLGRLAAAAYRSQGLGLDWAAVMATDSPRSVLDAMSTLGVLENRQSGVVDRVQASKIVAAVLGQQAGLALVSVTKAADAAAAARADVLAKVAAQTGQVALLNVQVASLSRSLVAAQARSTELTRARQAGLARAAAQRRAAALAAGRAGAHPSSGGSSGQGGGSSSHPGGGSQGSSTGAGAAIAYARAQLGKPYQWGGAGPNSFDCSGLTMRAWQAAGVQLPHWAIAQWQLSTPVPASQARPGDLVFYAYNLSDYTTIHHVALYIGSGLILEAAHTGTNVRISNVDGPGLFGFARP